MIYISLINWVTRLGNKKKISRVSAGTDIIDSYYSTKRLISAIFYLHEINRNFMEEIFILNFSKERFD